MRELAAVTVLAVILLSATALAVPATHAIDMFVKIAAADGGEPNGDHRGWIKVIRYEWDVAAAQEVASGKSTGRREHQSLVVVLAVDKSTPKLAEILQETGRIDDVLVDVYRPDGSYMGFTLREVRIQSVTRLDSEDKSGRRSLDEVTFTYKEIEWLKR